MILLTWMKRSDPAGAGMPKRGSD